MSQLEAAPDSGSLKTPSCMFQEAVNSPNTEPCNGAVFSAKTDSMTPMNETVSNSTGQQYLSTVPRSPYGGALGDVDSHRKEQFLQQNYGPFTKGYGAMSNFLGSPGYFPSAFPSVEAGNEPARFSHVSAPSTWSGLKLNFGSVAEIPPNVPNTIGVPPQWSAVPGRLSEENAPTFSFDSSDPSGRDKLIYDLERVNHWLRSELELARKEIDRLRAQLVEHERGKNKQESTKSQSRYWTPNEHQRFLEALRKFGHKDVKSISNYVGTRNPTQVRTHAQKYFLRLFKESRNRQEQGMGRGFSASRRSMSEPDLNRAELQNNSSQMYSHYHEMSQEHKENDDSCSSNLGSSNREAMEPKNGIRLLSLVATHETSSPCDREGGNTEEGMNTQDNTS